MYRFDGPMGKDYMKKRRAQKREEAEERNARTLPENRRQYRLEQNKQLTNTSD